MEIIKIKGGDNLSYLSKNPILYSLAVTPFTSAEIDAGTVINVSVEKETAYLNNIWESVYTQIFIPKSNGSIKFDISTIIDPHLTYYMPELWISQPEIATGQFGRFRITATIYTGAEDSGIFLTTPEITVYKGGVSDFDFNEDKFIGQHFGSLIYSPFIIPLHYEKKTRIFQQDRLFFFFIYRNQPNQDLLIEICGFNDNDNFHTFSVTSIINSPGNALWIMPMGYGSLNIGNSQIANPLARSYYFSCWRGGSGFSTTPRLNLIYENYPHCKKILFRNSLGALVLVNFLGKIEEYSNYTRSEFQQTGIEEYYTGIRIKKGKIQSLNIQEKYSINANTGWLPKEEIDTLRDLLISPEVYEIKKGIALGLEDELVPVIIQTEEALIFENEAQLFSLQIKWTESYINNNYSRHTTQPWQDTCPIPLNFQAFKLSDTEMKVVWATTQPYHKVLLTIIQTPSNLVYTLSGNSGVHIITGLTLTPDAEGLVQMNLVTVCQNNNSQPVNTVVQWDAPSPPVAIADYFPLDSGHTDFVFAGNVMANDYHPSGLSISVIAVTNGQSQNGNAHYNLNANGDLFYKPSTPQFLGPDTIFYTLTDGTNQVTGRVKIMVVL